MQKGKKYVASDGIEYFMCPFEAQYITQGSDGAYSHKGTMANDVRGLKAGIKYAYFAPCDLVCTRVVNRNNGETRWQSVNKVRFSNGRVDYATLEICHDNTCNAYVGMKLNQGQQLGNMGNAGKATGVHCHIQISQSKTNTFTKNKFGIYCFPNEYDTDDCYFMDDTNILNMQTANWKYIKDVSVEKKETWTKGTYKLLYDKAIRSSAKLGNNIIKVGNCTSATRKVLTSSNPKANAMIKAGSEVIISGIVKEGTRIWGQFGNCYICLCNVDGTKQTTKIA